MLWKPTVIGMARNGIVNDTQLHRVWSAFTSIYHRQTQSSKLVLLLRQRHLILRDFDDLKA